MLVAVSMMRAGALVFTVAPAACLLLYLCIFGQSSFAALPVQPSESTDSAPRNISLSLFTILPPVVPHQSSREFLMTYAALTTWLRVPHVSQILVFVDEPHMCDPWLTHFASPRITCLPMLCRDPDYHVPTMDCYFSVAVFHLRTDVLMFVNSDVMLFDEIGDVSSRLSREFSSSWVAVGRRVDIRHELVIEAMTDSDRQVPPTNALRSLKQQGTLHGAYGLDYFLMPRAVWEKLLPFPPFMVGRISWDNYLLWKAMDLEVPSVDVTAPVLALHLSVELVVSDLFQASRLRPGSRENDRMASSLSRYHSFWGNVFNVEWALQCVECPLKYNPTTQPIVLFEGNATPQRELIFYWLHNGTEELELALNWRCIAKAANMSFLFVTTNDENYFMLRRMNISNVLWVPVALRMRTKKLSPDVAAGLMMSRLVDFALHKDYIVSVARAGTFWRGRASQILPITKLDLAMFRSAQGTKSLATIRPTKRGKRYAVAFAACYEKWSAFPLYSWPQKLQRKCHAKARAAVPSLKLAVLHRVAPASSSTTAITTFYTNSSESGRPVADLVAHEELRRPDFWKLSSSLECTS